MHQPGAWIVGLETDDSVPWRELRACRTSQHGGVTVRLLE
jgi:hypothetical protein